MIPMPLRFALRGALSFGAGGLLVALAFWLVFYLPDPAAGPPPYTMMVLLGAWFIGGALGIALLGYRQCLSENLILPLLGFGGGFVLAGLMSLFTMISLQGGGRPDYLWGAIGFAIGFGVAGAIGGFCVRPFYGLTGLIAFGLAGALGGLASFWLSAHGAALASAPVLGFIIGHLGMLLPWVLGGALFGASIR